MSGKSNAALVQGQVFWPNHEMSQKRKWPEISALFSLGQTLEPKPWTASRFAKLMPLLRKKLTAKPYL
jgi:hypothetical protein